MFFRGWCEGGYNKVINLTNNVLSFYKLFADDAKAEGQDSDNVLDKWILSRLANLTKTVGVEMENYELPSAVRPIQSFVDELSTWFVRRSRDRFKGADEGDKQAALQTLRRVLLGLSKVIAPFTPFLAEHIYQEVGDKETSVHLELWPEVDEGLIDEKLEVEMQLVRDVVSLGLEKRAETKIPVRQVLGSAKVTVPSGELGEQFVGLIRDELNIKSVEVAKGDKAVELDTNLTPELIREGLVREVTRNINSLRKRAGLTIEDRIRLHWFSGDDEVVKVFEEFEEDIKNGVLADEVSKGKHELEVCDTIKLRDWSSWMGVEKL